MAATALAGVLLSVLRIVSGSLLVPWAVHTVVNAGGLVAAHLHQRGAAQRSTGRAVQRSTDRAAQREE